MTGPSRITVPVEGVPSAAAPCPCCGSYVDSSLGILSPLLAVADVLVVRALEAVGKRIVRAERSRFNRMGSRQWHEAHTVWPPEESSVVKTLANAWDVVPALLDTHGCCGVTSRQVTEMLDGYVRDLLITGTMHTFDQLRQRFSDRLGIEVPR